MRSTQHESSFYLAPDLVMEDLLSRQWAPAVKDFSSSSWPRDFANFNRYVWSFPSPYVTVTTLCPFQDCKQNLFIKGNIFLKEVILKHGYIAKMEMSSMKTRWCLSSGASCAFLDDRGGDLCIGFMYCICTYSKRWVQTLRRRAALLLLTVIICTYHKSHFSNILYLYLVKSFCYSNCDMINNC